MEVKIKQYWFNIQNSLWFLPSVMALSAAMLAFGLIQMDKHINYDNIPVDWFMYGGKREGARSVLSTIASSMVTIAGVTFSITLVALTMASTQFGPRLLRNFIADKGNQLVIGTFISTFIYSLIILLTIRDQGSAVFIPKISIVFAFLMAIFSLGVIIYFIHHVTTSIQADYVIKSSFLDFNKVLHQYILLKETDEEEIITREKLFEIRENNYNSQAVCFNDTGFIQSIDYSGICKWAEKNEVVVELLVHPGSFATVFQPLAHVFFRKDKPDNRYDEIHEFIAIGYQRTPNQDLLFSLKQIVEVGVRALSPGINDPHTAVTCINWLGAALALIAKSRFKQPIHMGSNGIVRVFQFPINYKAIVDTCFDNLLHYGKSNIFVTDEVLKTIKVIIPLVQNHDLKEALLEKSTNIFKEMHQEYGKQKEIELIENHYREIMALS